MRDERLFLDDIIEAAVDIANFVAGLTSEEFSRNKRAQFAVLARLSHIGEAVKNLSTETKNKIKGVEWEDLAGFRDVAVHQYFAIEWQLVWVAIKDEIPQVAQKIKEFTGSSS